MLILEIMLRSAIMLLYLAGAKIYSESIIGDHCVIHSGAVIGADGFGFCTQ